MGSVNNKGFSVRFIDEGGSGVPVFLLHEMGLCLDTWDPLIEQADTQSYRFLRMDMRGSGLSQKLIDTPNISDFLEDINLILQACKIDQPTLFVGGAIGGALALTFASTYPEKTLAVIAASPAVGVAEDAKTRTLAMADQVEDQGLLPLLKGAEDTFFPPPLRTDNNLEHFLQIHSAMDSKSYACIYRMIANLDLNNTLIKISTPTLLLGGELDLLRPAAVVEALAKTIPDSEYRLIKTGHFSSVQTPSLLLNLINEMSTALSKS